MEKKLSQLLASIEEIQECGKRKANHYLAHHYILLDIQARAEVARMPEDSSSGHQYYVRRNAIYILGRPKGVEPAPEPPKWTPQNEPAAADG